MSSSNSWLARQRKSDLYEIARHLGVQEYEALKKTELEVLLDEYISDNLDQFSLDPKLQNYFASRNRMSGSPVKKETLDLKVSRRRTRMAEEVVASEVEEEQEPETVPTMALARTPGRAFALAQRIPLPASPADVARAVDNSTLVVRERVSSLYQESGIPEVTLATRATLSTVHSILVAIASFELWYLRSELMPWVYAFTFPAIAALGTSDQPVHIPDMFVLLSSSFWSPALTWAFTSFIVPSLFGYLFNLRAANTQQAQPVSRSRAAIEPEYKIDPLTFSVAKALITYVVYAQGATFNNMIDQTAVARINSALYGGWKSVIVGAAVSGLAAIYDAVLQK